MLDIQFIRENKEKVKEKSAQKGYQVDIDKLLQLDAAARTKQAELDQLRQQRNQLSSKLSGQPDTGQLATAKALKDQIAKLEADLKPLSAELDGLLKAVPNMPLDDVPIGASEADNQVVLEWGTKPQFNFPAKNHWQLAEARGWIDKDRAAKISGSRFAYIMGDLVKLQLAVVNFTIDVLTDTDKLKTIAEAAQLNVSHQPFVPVLPPLLLRTEVFDAMDRLEPREERYKIQDEELWLEGSAEHVLGPLHMDEIMAADQLPIRYLGYATSFRREAGSYGKDMAGIIRMHQFDKLEMESFSLAGKARDEHLFLVAIQEYLMQQLGLAYRKLLKCTFDIGKPNARGVDLDAWLPGQAKYCETHTADYMTDYQARRLKTRTKNAAGAIELVHTNDATALALGRTLVAIIENYQTADGQVTIPAVLRPLMQGREVI